MKADIHPEYREVLFHDSGADKYFLIPSTLETSETREYEGKTYPYYPLEYHYQTRLCQIPFLTTNKETNLRVGARRG